MQLAYLLLMGFAIGLSGAMMPGPLMAYLVSETLKKGARTGPLIILGHVMSELMLMALIALGLSSMVNSPQLMKAIGFIGGLALAFMGVGLARSRLDLDGAQVKGHENTLLGGIFYSTFNPGFPVWWATAGTAMLLKGFETAGYWGVAAVVVGHWFADAGYFMLICLVVHHGRRSILFGRRAAYIKNVLAIVLFAFGAYFSVSALYP